MRSCERCRGTGRCDPGKPAHQGAGEGAEFPSWNKLGVMTWVTVACCPSLTKCLFPETTCSKFNVAAHFLP